MKVPLIILQKNVFQSCVYLVEAPEVRCLLVWVLL